jgi:hypothetical protein
MILTVYNLPLRICIKLEFMFLSMVILDPNSLSQNIDIFFQLLIDELKQLWSFRALTYEVSRKQNFLMKVTLMWIINDFLAYGMVCIWITYGKLSCSYCMKNNNAFTLTNDGKMYILYCHQRFLSTDHRF